jgi:hypothetical protein
MGVLLFFGRLNIFVPEWPKREFVGLFLLGTFC